MRCQSGITGGVRGKGGQGPGSEWQQGCLVRHACLSWPLLMQVLVSHAAGQEALAPVHALPCAAVSKSTPNCVCQAFRGPHTKPECA